MQPKVTANRKTAGPQKPKPKPKAAPIPAAGKPKTKAAASVETAASKPTTPNMVVPTQISISALVRNYDLLDHHLLDAGVELTHRLLTSIFSLPTGAARGLS